MFVHSYRFNVLNNPELCLVRSKWFKRKFWHFACPIQIPQYKWWSPAHALWWSILTHTWYIFRSCHSKNLWQKSSSVFLSRMSVETNQVNAVKSLNQHSYIRWILRLWNKISSRRLFWSCITWSQTKRNSRRNLQNWGSFQTIWKWVLSCEWNKSKDVLRSNICTTRSQWRRQDNYFEHDYWSAWCIDRKCWSFWSWPFQKYEIS